MLTVNDAEYLQEYLAISQSFIDGKIPLGQEIRYNRETNKEEDVTPSPKSALAKLAALNAKYGALTSPGVLKQRVMATILAAHQYDGNDEGWAVSGIC